MTFNTSGVTSSGLDGSQLPSSRERVPNEPHLKMKFLALILKEVCGNIILVQQKVSVRTKSPIIVLKNNTWEDTPGRRKLKVHFLP